MKIALYFDSVEEFSLFICSAAAIDFRIMPKSGVDMNRCLATREYWPFLNHVFEIHVAGVTYTVDMDTSESQHVDCRVINYMLNEVQMKSDNIRVLIGDETVLGSSGVRKHIEKLPENFGLRAGWRTDSFSYVFLRK